ncbi:MAG TPA: phosphoglycerate kinase [Candidatus Saccharimonadales bacterium]|nr:phosphoglycerate kinase [Candidatus Saccharimonadales bacterium]
MKLPDIRNAKVNGKKVLLRLDFDVPLKAGKVEDDSRLASSLETLTFLLNHHATVIACGHLGRPEGKADTKFSLKPVAQWFAHKIKSKNSNLKNEMFGSFPGWKLASNFIILENIRFFKGEEKNDSEFSKQLASLADLYVDDAFAAVHRNHASIAGVAKLLPHFAGFHLQKEVEVLSNVLEHPKRPLIVLIGGAKIETKLPLVEKMHRFADYVLVGGKIAEETRKLLKVQHERVSGKKSVLLVGDLNSDETDMTPKNVENFLQILQLGKTIVWNGPVGKTESAEGCAGTKKLAYGITATHAYTVIGGGDTEDFLKREHLLSKFSFVSTGGGAMLSFLAGETLPGLEALT